MPVRNKTYPLTTAAGAASTRPVPTNPNRVSLIIQNTGANPGQVRFAEPGQGVGADMLWVAGFIFKWDQADTCPKEAINVSSTLATTWVIVEGTNA